MNRNGLDWPITRKAFMRPKRRGKVRNLVWANGKKCTEISLIRITEFYPHRRKMLVRKMGYFQG
jgi:hypothetical protein